MYYNNNKKFFLLNVPIKKFKLKNNNYRTEHYPLKTYLASQ